MKFPAGCLSTSSGTHYSPPPLTGNAAILAAHDWELLRPMFHHSANLNSRLLSAGGMGYNSGALASQGPGQDRLSARAGGEQPWPATALWVADDGGSDMCTMTIPSSVCRKKPVRIDRDRTLDGLAAYVRQQCATKKSARAYLASVGVRRSANGTIRVIPL